MHTVRRVFSFGLFILSKSAVETAHYLGDEPGTVMDTYGTISGEFTNVAALRGVQLFTRTGVALPAHTQPASLALPGRLSVEPVAAQGSGGHELDDREYGSELLSLLQAHRDNWLTDTEYQSAKAELLHRHASHRAAE